MELLAIWLGLSGFIFYMAMRFYFTLENPEDEDVSVWDFVVVGPLGLIISLVWPIWPLIFILVYFKFKKR